MRIRLPEMERSRNSNIKLLLPTTKESACKNARLHSEVSLQPEVSSLDISHFMFSKLARDRNAGGSGTFRGSGLFVGVSF